MSIAAETANATAAAIPARAALEDGGAMLAIIWVDGGCSRFPAIWLADNRPERRVGAEGQRVGSILDLPEHVELSSATLAGSEIDVAFSCFERPSRFDAAWLRRYALDEASRAARRFESSLWDSRLAASLPAEHYGAVAKDKTALARWLGHVRTRGFALLHGVPTVPGTVCDVVELFGYVRETNYGRLFDVVSVEKPQNLAYTAMALGNHTDNPYRDPVPQLQLLHCLEAAEEGGESVVVDGFAAADLLRREAPDAFALLTTMAVPFRYVEPGRVDLRHRAPLIALDGDGRVEAVRFNERSIAPIDLAPKTILGFYAAYRRFARLLHDPSLTVGFRLRPGDLFIVDNRRVLHGRRGYAGGCRHLQGAYADADSLSSRLRVLETGL